MKSYAFYYGVYPASSIARPYTNISDTSRKVGLKGEEDDPDK
jgi:hypothetical protein